MSWSPARSASDESERIRAAIAEAQRKLAHNGRVLVRASGTEAVVRVMVEASSSAIAADVAGRLGRIVAEELA